MSASTNETRPDDDAFVARLAAADPAAGTTVDLEELRRSVRVHTGQGDELGERRSRRARRMWLPAVAAAATLVVATSAGYGAGARWSSGGVADSESLTMAENLGDEPPAPAMDSGAAATSLMPGSGLWGGHTLAVDSGLPDQTTTAHMFALDTQVVDPAEVAARAGQALGVEGRPEAVGERWVVGPDDGSAPTVWVGASSGTLAYYDQSADPWFCEPDTPQGDEREDCGERSVGPAPAADQAKAQMASILVALGQDQGDYELTESHGGDPITYVTAWRLVEGRRTGVTWSAAFTGAGLLSLNGTMASLVDLGAYPVISPADAVARLNDPQFLSGGDIRAYDQGVPAQNGDALVYGGDVDGAVAPDATQSELGAASAPPVPAPGSALDWPVQRVTIVSAELQFDVYYQRDGAAVLAPTYLLTGSDGSQWGVVALAEDALNFS